MIRISTVTPVYAGQDYLTELVEKLDKVRSLFNALNDQLKLEECIFVLDGPRDESAVVLQRIQNDHAWVRTVELSKNFGQHNATAAGILHSSGDWIVTLDEDLQHPPEAIPRLLKEAVKDSSDVLFAIPNKGAHNSLFRDFSSLFAKKLIGIISGSAAVQSFGSFRVIRGQIARAAASVCTHQTYFDIALTWFTDRIICSRLEMKDQRYEKHKISGYSLGSLLGHAKRLLLSSEVRFFQLALFVSGISVMLALGLLTWVLFSYFVTPDEFMTQGWASLMSVNLFFGGAFAVLIGFTLEILRSGQFHSQGKPTFFVVDRANDSHTLAALQQLVDQGTMISPQSELDQR